MRAALRVAGWRTRRERLLERGDGEDDYEKLYHGKLATDVGAKSVKLDFLNCC